MATDKHPLQDYLKNGSLKEAVTYTSQDLKGNSIANDLSKAL
jgi:hypothetical protein